MNWSCLAGSDGILITVVPVGAAMVVVARKT